VEGGLSFPIDPEAFSLFAVTEHVLDYGESKGIAERYIMTDTAGEGALEIGEIKTGSSSGGGGSNFADLSTPTQVGVVIGLIVLLLVLGITSTIMLRRWIKQKKKEEQEFINHVEKLNEEGKDLFGKERVDEELKKASYDDLYGTSTIKRRSDPTLSSVDTLPSIGVSMPDAEIEKKLDVEVKWSDEE
jgi:hypothetical protein